MSNINEFCDGLDLFIEETEDLLCSTQLEIAEKLLGIARAISPQPGIAKYATGEYKKSHHMQFDTEKLVPGSTITISPDTDHDMAVEYGREGGYWMVKSGYQVYAALIALIGRYK